jgi:hypothetical protein
MGGPDGIVDVLDLVELIESWGECLVPSGVSQKFGIKAVEASRTLARRRDEGISVDTSSRGNKASGREGRQV